MTEKNLQIIVPAGMFGANEFDTALDTFLRELGKKFGSNNDWPDKYGTNIENEIFLMHRYCWCDSDECLWCGGSQCQNEVPEEPHRPGCYQERLRELQKTFGEREEWGGSVFYHVSYDSPKRAGYEDAKRKLCVELEKDYDSGNEVHCSCGLDEERRAKYDACQCDWHLGLGRFCFGKAADAPNFWYKPLNFQVTWYKYIGRSTKVNRELNSEEFEKMRRDCLAAR